MQEASSTKILPRMAAGDSEAINECLSHYGNLVWAMARRMSFDPNDTEDAVQEIFVDLWKSAGRFDPDRAPEPVFVTTIARRRLVDRQRRSRREPAFEPLYETVPNGDDLHEEAARQSMLVSLTKALKVLPTDRRRVTALAVLHGMTHSQIADATGLPLGTVKSHIRRGLSKVQNQLRSPLPARSREDDGARRPGGGAPGH